MKLELKRGKWREKFLVGKKQFCSVSPENRGNMGVSPQILGKVKYLMNYFLEIFKKIFFIKNNLY